MTLMTKKTHQQGFTITEAIVTLAIFGIMTLAVVGGISATQAAQRNEHYLDIANTTARQIIEESRNGQFATLTTSGSPYDRTSRVPSTLPQGRATMVVSQSGDMPNFKRLDVTVSYTIGSYTRDVVQTAYIGEGGITQ